MNRKKAMVCACAVAASILNTSVEAASGQEGLEACVSALTRDLSSAQGSAVHAQISEDSKVATRRLDQVTTYHLDARNSSNHGIVARVDCIVDEKGRVKRLVKLPNDAPDAETRSL